MKTMFLILMVVFSSLLNPNISYAIDVLVWQGQYYAGTTFNRGTYEFNFSVYDNLTEGNICYINTINLTTGNFGEWKTEQRGVSSSCNNVSKEYYLNIGINGVNQHPRRILTTFDFLRKNVNESSSGSIETDLIKVRQGLKDLNKNIWQSKLDYAEEFANATLIAQELLSQAHISSDKNISDMSVGESIELKKARLIAAAELAKTGIEANAMIAKAKILEAKKLALLNGETLEDVAEIEEKARLKESALNLTATEYKRLVDIALNSSLAEVEASDDEIRFCLSDGTNCNNISALNLTAGGDYIYTDAASIYLNETKLNGTIDARTTTPDLIGYALKNQSETFAGDITTSQTGFFGWIGSLISRITKLWVVDIDAIGNIETSENVSAKYIKGDGSLLTNFPGGGGLVPAYLGTTLNATNAAYTTIFTIPLTPSKMNIVKAYLAQSSSTTGVAVQNRATVNESGPVGYCHFETQTGATGDATDNIAVSTNSADTGMTTMALDINLPIISTIVCTVLADDNQKNLIIQFDSETAATVTTYAGSYYTNAVN